jgi:hypothetical protein
VPIFQCRKIGKKKKNLDVHSSMLSLCFIYVLVFFSLLRHLPKYLPIINEKRTMMNELQLLIEMWIMMDELHPSISFSHTLSLSSFFSFLFFSPHQLMLCPMHFNFAWHWVDPFVDQSIEVLWALGFVPCEAVELKFSKLASCTSLEQGGGWACYLLRVEVWVVKVKIDPIQMTKI